MFWLVSQDGKRMYQLDGQSVETYYTKMKKRKGSCERMAVDWERRIGTAIDDADETEYVICISDGIEEVMGVYKEERTCAKVFSAIAGRIAVSGNKNIVFRIPPQERADRVTATSYGEVLEWLREREND